MDSHYKGNALTTYLLLASLLLGLANCSLEFTANATIPSPNSVFHTLHIP